MLSLFHEEDALFIYFFIYWRKKITGLLNFVILAFGKKWTKISVNGDQDGNIFSSSFKQTNEQKNFFKKFKKIFSKKIYQIHHSN